MKYIEYFVIMYVDKMNIFYLLLIGEGDWNVFVVNIWELYYVLCCLGKEVVWVNYKIVGYGVGWVGIEEMYYD